MTVTTIINDCLVCRIVYEDGTAVEVPMTRALSRAIERMDEAERKREERRKRREASFTDARVEGDRLAAKHVPPRRASGYDWEGPRYEFSRLVGESRIWRGPRLADVAPLMLARLEADLDDPWCRVERPGMRAPCEFCRGAGLGPGEYCLRCDRSGRDGDPEMRPTRADLAKRKTVNPKADPLRGGK